MSEKSLSDLLGIDVAAQDALARAGVRTVEELSAADAETLATESGVPVDRVRDWQRRAQKVAARAGGRSPVLTGWLVAIIGLVIAGLVGWATISIGTRRIQDAEQTKVEVQSQLRIAVTFAANQAVAKLREARLELHNKNWGSAQMVLSSVEDHITFIEQVAPDEKSKQVGRIRAGIGDLQRAVGKQSADAVKQLDALEAALAELARPE